MNTQQFNSTESFEPLRKRQSFESEVSESAISTFGVDHQPAQQQQLQPREYRVQDQVVYQQGYVSQGYGQGHYNPGYAMSEVSYQSSGYDRNMYPASAVGYQNAPHQMHSEKGSNLNRFSVMSGKSINTERYCCGIFKSKKKCFWICVPLWVFFVVVLALTGFFVWPRIPGFRVGAPQNVNTKEFGTIEDLRNSSPDRPFRARFDLRVDVTVQSENYIPWTFNEIKIEGKLINPETGKPNLEKIGNGTRRNIVLQPRNTTTFGFIFTASYLRTESLTRENRARDERLRTLALACRPEAFGLARPQNYPVGILKIDIATQINFLGINIGAPSRISEFQCPQSVYDLLDMVVKVTEVFL